MTFQVVLKLFIGLAFREAWVFKRSSFAVLKRIKNPLYKGIQYQKVFCCLGRSSVEIVFKNLQLFSTLFWGKR